MKNEGPSNKTEGPSNRKMSCAGVRGSRDLLRCSTDTTLTVYECATMEKMGSQAVNLVTRLFAEFDEQAARLSLYKAAHDTCGFLLLAAETILHHLSQGALQGAHRQKALNTCILRCLARRREVFGRLARRPKWCRILSFNRITCWAALRSARPRAVQKSAGYK